MNIHAYPVQVPELSIDAVESVRGQRKKSIAFHLKEDLKFSTEALQSYAFSRWDAVIHDAMVVAAVVEFADKSVKRPPRGWARRLCLRIPVHDPKRWQAPSVSDALHDALGFLTGDYWTIKFVKRTSKAEAPSQEHLNLGVSTEAVIAYSEGMDSRAVTGLIGASLGDRLVRVHLGSSLSDSRGQEGKVQPFTTIPYSVKTRTAHREATARSRGFKFALISGLAAYLTEAETILIPESGQGAIGPALVSVGHAYPDYRNHPLYTRRMARFLTELLGKEFRFEFPRIWYTKGETLREFVALADDNGWRDTRSCWRGAQWCSIEKKLRQCGICAACMLRRLSVHAAGLTEKPDTYVCQDMSAATLREAIDRRFTKYNAAFEQYAIAGILHLDHLADLAQTCEHSAVARHAAILAPAMNLTPDVAESRLKSLLNRHAAEWHVYIKELSKDSFVRKWIRSR